MSRVAVLISVYKNDSVEYLKRSVDSILCQAFQEFHLFIAVDGFVSNETGSYLFELETLSDKITVIYFDTKSGLATRLNDVLESLDLGGFEYVARMDADDISPPLIDLKRKFNF